MNYLIIGIVLCCLACSIIGGLNSYYIWGKEKEINSDLMNPSNDPLYFGLTLTGIVLALIGTIVLIIHARTDSHDGYQKLLDEDHMNAEVVKDNYALLSLKAGYDPDLLDAFINDPNKYSAQLKEMAKQSKNYA